MNRLFSTYKAVHTQGFMPIFVHDEFPTYKLLDACLEAGCRCIEYTLRRPDAAQMIPIIREKYPDIYLLAGSTLDADKVVTQMRGKFPQLMTIRELDQIGVDGFVSMIGWSSEKIAEYSSTKLIIPTAMTVTEALMQVKAGAHFNKLLGPDVSFARLCRGQAAFDYCPIMMTGGMTPDKIPTAINAGVVIVGAGFDLILKGQEKSVSIKKIKEILRVFIDVTIDARLKQWPSIIQNHSAQNDIWLRSLPHYHPFS